ncbi:MAG: hypothetical protein SP1CHLAM54_10690 [Chlamydiia bacterium]|nr:hypothetical protein [Chlamydiia bacterium]MCH9615974.1 hypothetical protein [Chlamydiia bacterium]MCH9628623.1 hypothetical protein [Chlamydiia bacterium]
MGIIKGGIYGGVIVYVWMIISYTVLPWHHSTMQSFSSERHMSNVVTENCKTDGIYVMPHSAENEGKAPFVFMSVRLKGHEMGTATFIISLITQVIGAAFISYLLSRTAALMYAAKVIFVIFAGFVAWLLGMFPSWNWIGFPASYVFVSLADFIIGWFLAGLVMAKVVRTHS